MTLIATGSLAEVAPLLLRGLVRHFEDHGQTAIGEVTLASGRRADLLCLDRKGGLTIVEIKSGPADFRADGKWPEYMDFCDRFYFAVAADFPRDLLPEDCGLLIADAYGAHEERPAQPLPLSPARRKAVTLLFAQTAARRLNALLDPRP